MNLAWWCYIDDMQRNNLNYTNICITKAVTLRNVWPLLIKFPRDNELKLNLQQIFFSLDWTTIVAGKCPFSVNDRLPPPFLAVVTAESRDGATSSGGNHRKKKSRCNRLRKVFGNVGEFSYMNCMKSDEMHDFESAGLKMNLKGNGCNNCESCATFRVVGF